MSIVDWIDIVCAIASAIAAIVSLIVACVLGFIQVQQGKQMKRLEDQQAKRDLARYNDTVDIEVRRFLSKYHESLSLLPLCAVALVYNPNIPYRREMYSEFRLLSEDVRRKIFERCELHMCDVQTDNFFNDCLYCLEKAVGKFMVRDNFMHMFYDSGKYLKYSLSIYAAQKCPDYDCTYTDTYSHKIDDIISVAFMDSGYCSYTESVIDQIQNELNFQGCREVDACEIACLTAKHIAIYAGLKLRQQFCVDCNINYGCPDEYSGLIETMEDMFFLTLFEIWSNLWCLKKNEGECCL